MNAKGIIPILNVSDVPASIAWFERLGWSRCWTYNDSGMIEGAADANATGPAKFAAVGSGEVEVFLCHNGQGGREDATDRAARVKAMQAGEEDFGKGVWMTVWVGSPTEVDQVHAKALAMGAMVIQPPTDEPWGVRECRIVHPDGHTFRISGSWGRK